MKLVPTSSLGFPRIGPNRELKFALEKYWKGTISQHDLLQVARSVEDAAWALQVGLTKITVGDQYLYDFVLMMTESLGMVPKRFAHLPPGIDRLFAMARGVDGAPALSMKKWITSNYHYMVPEYDETSQIHADFSRFLEDCRRGVATLGADCATPVLLGPVSFAYLTKISAPGVSRSTLVDLLLPVYEALIQELVGLGVKEIQIHEPCLVFNDPSINPLLDAAYPKILAPDVTINMVSYMDDVGDTNYQWLMSAANGIHVVSLDFTRGDTLALVQKYGATKTIGCGLVDARNVWKFDPATALPVLKCLVDKGVIFRIQPSSTLQFLPWTVEREDKLIAESHPALQVLAFAKEKLQEVARLAKVAGCLLDGEDSEHLLSDHESAWKSFVESRQTSQSSSVRDRLQAVQPSDFRRSTDYLERRKQQLKGLPALPTTTIGSFPQTSAIRRVRAAWKKGLLNDAEYQAAMDQQIAYCIGVQETLGLDILVHGEPERTDMVEFFGEQLEGILFTQHGWVQSFGSRCVRPPVFWNDISRPFPMTTREFKVAQSLTEKPVKGMLTGPITILNWSFPRIDISGKDQAFQIALCIRDEIRDLEEAGCIVVQVDEPALREGMPFRTAERDEYLNWAVDAFRLSTAGAKSETQIHTHMCYCEFQDCMHAIDRMDTDVNSIENARSDNATLKAFKSIGYTKGFGPGLYDIHSPVVPSRDEIEAKLRSFLTVLDLDQTVVNPDCGLKTRGWPETIAALRNMVEATAVVRNELSTCLPCSM
ncbi:5-methyltetrahydropteroyltriglutamate--homocysteine methyltransferase [Fistulifera solaris]|uniref:5-methyltetrahydropteroyltriglutamate--homocysteine S-methyltransferase n=1 Tax=Fistulifera solaris TaxID=1519565 RepID=A0A1Z5JFR1_FISSO|nr:5-methyltetrahydropteroyltriglutamate--homocysteine methyltransferase [Fistulifera solaris]|eukprot:GAX12819.1 5-methyltetrahydropteroyltriglutamate--homocysteine methyltransferase [Fistulifera solaris]